MNKKRTIRLNEKQLYSVINGAVGKLLNEYSQYVNYDYNQDGRLSTHGICDEEMCNQIAYDAKKLYTKFYKMKDSIDNLRFITAKKQYNRRGRNDFNPGLEFSELYSEIESKFQELLNAIGQLSDEASIFAHGDNGVGVIHMDGVVR